MPDDAPLAWEPLADEEDETFLMASLFPRTTGLPMTIWVNERGGARHDVRLKVNTVHGPCALRAGEQAVVAVRPEPHLVHGALSKTDLEAVIAWIGQNREIILDYWNGEADTADLLARQKRLPG